MKNTPLKSRLFLFALMLVVVLSPFVVTSILLAVQHQASFFDHAPFWSDELYHWHQATSFAEAGFNGGYYTLNEQIPSAGWSHFYAWGAALYVYYGGLMTFTGTGLAALQLINIVTFFVVGLFFCVNTRFDWQRLVTLGLVFATFIPLVNYLASSMAQVLHLSLVLIMAAGFYQLLTRDVSRRFVGIFVIFLMLAGLLRPTYAVFLFPVFFLGMNQRTWRGFGLALVQSIPLALVSGYLFYISAAPFPFPRTILLSAEGLSWGERLSNYLVYIGESIASLTTADPIGLVQRFQILVLIGLLLLWGLWQWRRNSEREWFWEWLLHLFNIVGIYGLTLALHEINGGHDYRVMAPHLFLSLVLLVAFRRWTILAPMLIVTVFAFPTLYDNFQWKDPNYNGIVAEQYEQWSPQLTDVMTYDTDAPNAWCNTVTTSAYYVVPAQGDAGLILAVPHGIGLSWLEARSSWVIPQTFKARYLLLTDEDFATMQEHLNVRELLRVNAGRLSGVLYDNLDSPCYDNPSE